MQSIFLSIILPTAIGLVGAAVLGAGLFGDRARGRLRCPRCWYEIVGAEAPLTCSECGRRVRRLRHLRRTRRRWRVISLGVLLLAGAWIAARVPGRGWGSVVPNIILAVAAPYAPASDSGARSWLSWTRDEFMRRIDDGRLDQWEFDLFVRLALPDAAVPSVYVDEHCIVGEPVYGWISHATSDPTETFPMHSGVRATILPDGTKLSHVRANTVPIAFRWRNAPPLPTHTLRDGALVELLPAAPATPGGIEIVFELCHLSISGRGSMMTSRVTRSVHIVPAAAPQPLETIEPSPELTQWLESTFRPKVLPLAVMTVSDAPPPVPLALRLQLLRDDVIVAKATLPLAEGVRPLALWRWVDPAAVVVTEERTPRVNDSDPSPPPSLVWSGSDGVPHESTLRGAWSLEIDSDPIGALALPGANHARLRRYRVQRRIELVCRDLGEFLGRGDGPSDPRSISRFYSTEFECTGQDRWSGWMTPTP